MSYHEGNVTIRYTFIQEEKYYSYTFKYPLEYMYNCTCVGLLDPRKLMQV